MKKAVKLTALLMACLMMVSICSCNGKKADETSKDTSEAATTTTTTSEETTTEETTEATSGNKVSAQTLKEIYDLSSSVLGKDITVAEQAIGEYFGTDLEDVTGHFLSVTIAGIATTGHTYSLVLSKDNVRFNGLSIYTGEEDGLVKRVEFVLKNTSYVTAEIEDTPEFRTEIRNLFNSMKDELDKTYGEAFETGKVQWDEDSFCFSYKASDNCYAYVEIRDFTQPGGNDLLSTKLIIADCKELLLS